MLNFFYMYAIVWGGILLFYSFGWSDLCTPLAPELAVFFSVTILVSLLLGYIFRSMFRFQVYEIKKKRNRNITFFIVAYCILEFLYCKQIPLFNIIFGDGKYTEYTGIPTLHTLIISYASFYAQYLIYIYICDHSDRKLIIEYFTILTFIYLFQFNRGGFIISIFMTLYMFLGINENEIRKKINLKHIFIVCICILMLLFGFGVMGNLRHGYSASNSQYIQVLGQFNDTYPSWLPKQFMWAYIYIVSPIANINYNVTIQFANNNIVGYIMTLVPDFISRRTIHGEIYPPKLILEHIFNATSGFGTAYTNGGIFGMYFLYFYLMFGLLLIWSIIPIKKEYRMPCLAIMNIIVVFMFFTHTIYYSAISFQIIFPLLSKIFVVNQSKKQFK